MSFYVTPFWYQRTLNTVITFQNLYYSMFKHSLCWFIIRHHRVSKIKFLCVVTWSAYTLVDVYTYIYGEKLPWLCPLVAQKDRIDADAHLENTCSKADRDYSCNGVGLSGALWSIQPRSGPDHPTLVEDWAAQGWF